jgi:hypothetical protein
MNLTRRHYRVWLIQSVGVQSMYQGRRTYR